MGTAGRRTHHYQKPPFPVSGLSNTPMLTLEEAWRQLAELVSLPIPYQALRSRVPTDLHCPGRFISFCFKKQLERYRVSEPLP